MKRSEIDHFRLAEYAADDPPVFRTMETRYIRPSRVVVTGYNSNRVAVVRIIEDATDEDGNVLNYAELSEREATWPLQQIVAYDGPLSVVLGEIAARHRERAATYDALCDAAETLDARLTALDGRIDVTPPLGPNSRQVVTIRLDAEAAATLIEILGLPEGVELLGTDRPTDYAAIAAANRDVIQGHHRDAARAILGDHAADTAAAIDRIDTLR